MKYISLDLETTGLDPDCCDILQIGMIYDDGVSPVKDLPRISIYNCKKSYYCEPFAAAMNKVHFERICAKTPGHRYCSTPEELRQTVEGFVSKFDMDGRLRLAGANIGMFDWQFIRVDGCFNGLKAAHRMLEIGSACLLPGDLWIPSLPECCERNGIAVDPASCHDAVYDAELVVRCVRARGL